jgi:type VI secretion system protein ImpB
VPESNSIQHKLDRVRSPRVQITYDVETGGAIAKKELPLVVGILADLSGNIKKDANGNAFLPPMKERKFVEIDRDNFNAVLEKAEPRLHLSVADTSDATGKKKIAVDLLFKSLDSFTPFEVVSNVAALKALYDSRNRLADLAAKLDGNEALEIKLRDAAKNAAELGKFPAIEAGA